MKAGLRAGPLLAAAALLFPACGSGGPSGPAAGPRLHLVASSSRLPPSINQVVTLVSPRRACYIDSYRVLVLCGGRAWDRVDTIGSEGEGPGEYRKPLTLARAARDTLGVVDGRTGRLELFAADGSIVTSVHVPSGFAPLGAPRDGVWAGTHFDFHDATWSAPVAWVSLEADSIVRRLKFRDGIEADAPPGIAGPATRLRDGTLVFWPRRDYVLARYAPDGRLLGTFGRPDFQRPMPSDRDVEEHREGYRSIFHHPLAEKDVEAFRKRREGAVLGGESMAVDSAGRLWVATTRDHDRRSWLDVFRDEVYVTSVPVKGRLLGLDILGGTLVALVEGARRDGVGLYPRRLDWYRIEG